MHHDSVVTNNDDDYDELGLLGSKDDYTYIDIYKIYTHITNPQCNMILFRNNEVITLHFLT